MRRSLLRVIVIAILLIATYRGFSMLVSDPLLAMGNNYDMIRVQACIDAYPARPDSVPAWSNSPQAPIGRYRFQSVQTASCFATSEALFAFLAKPFMWAESRLAKDATFSIRWIGAVKLTALLLLSWSFSFLWMQCGSEPSALLNALVVAIVLVDPANTLYLNGFYAELAAVIFAYAAVAGTVLAITCKFRLTPLFVGVAVVGLCMTKIQHAAAGMAIAFALLAVRLSGRRSARRVIASLLVASLVGMALQLANLERQELQTMRLANMTNVVFSAIMPLSQRPSDVADFLGLPEGCAQHSGLSWWRPPVNQNAERHPCREVGSVSHLRLFLLTLRDPSTMFHFLSGGARHLRPWLGNRTPSGHVYLGTVEGQVLSDLPKSWFSWSRVLDRLDRPQFAAFLIAPTVILLAMALPASRGLVGAPLASVLAMLVFLAWATYFSVLFGNGYMDMAKVSNIMTNALLVFWLIAIAVSLYWMARALRSAYTEQAAKLGGNIDHAARDSLRSIIRT